MRAILAVAVLLAAGSVPASAIFDSEGLEFLIPNIPAQGNAIWGLDQAASVFAAADKDLPADLWARAAREGWVVAAYASDAKGPCAGEAFHPEGLRQGDMPRAPSFRAGPALVFVPACASLPLDRLEFRTGPVGAKRFETAGGDPGLALGALVECRGLDTSVVLCRVEEKIGGSTTHYFGIGEPMKLSR